MLADAFSCKVMSFTKMSSGRLPKAHQTSHLSCMD
jgi:hypothetical protein